MNLRKDAQTIIDAAIKSALPDTAVKKALEGEDFSEGRLILVSIGKAAWFMAKAACDFLEDQIDQGIVITKYNHSKGELKNIKIVEAGHPVPDENSFKATKEAIDMVKDLNVNDKVLLLISGGGSALFESPLIDKDILFDLTKQLLASGADIVEMNTVRKRLSAVKGGKFAKICEPAKVFCVVLSDIIGDPLDMIASGPAYPDSSTGEEALNILDKYNIKVSKEIKKLLNAEKISEIHNVDTKITGSVTQLCEAAKRTCTGLGYEPIILTTSLNCQAKEAGSFMASIARHHMDSNKSLAFIAGGETVVQLKGKGMGGRNQELALSAADGIEGLKDTLVFSVGSDGTDGPTDAAGGIVTGESKKTLESLGIEIYDVLEDNDSYHALNKIDGLIITGPTGTNVNDLSVLLIKR